MTFHCADCYRSCLRMSLSCERRRLAAGTPSSRPKPSCRPCRPNARLTRPASNPLRRPHRRHQAASEAFRQAIPA